MSFRPGNTHIGNCLDVWDRLREATEKDGCGTKHFLRKKLTFLPNAPSENSLPSCSLLPRLQIDMARSQNCYRIDSRWQMEKLNISEFLYPCHEAGVFRFDWKPCHLYYALIQLDPKTKGGLKLLKGKVTKLEPHLSYLFPIKTMPNASCPIQWALLTASTILILASASRGLWKRHSGIPVWKCPKCNVLQSST